MSSPWQITRCLGMHLVKPFFMLRPSWLYFQSHALAVALQLCVVPSPLPKSQSQLDWVWSERISWADVHTYEQTLAGMDAWMAGHLYISSFLCLGDLFSSHHDHRRTNNPGAFCSKMVPSEKQPLNFIYRICPCILTTQYIYSVTEYHDLWLDFLHHLKTFFTFLPPAQSFMSNN